MEIKSVKSIDELQTYFGCLYGEINNKRDWQDIYGYLSRTTGYLTRNILKKRSDIQDFIRAFSWLFALANKLDINLQNSFYKKFPGICPYCLEENCCCVKTNKKPIEYRPAYKIAEELQAKFDVKERFGTKDLSSAAKNISKIYPANNAIWHFAGPWVNCSKLFEEVAEIHEAISKFLIHEKRKENVEEEFADVCAWLLSAWDCCNQNKNIDQEIVNYFYHGCPVCHSNPCTCDTNDGRIQGLVDAKRFAELRGLFEQLEKISPHAKEDVQDLILSLKSAENSQSETVATAAISEAKTKYERLTKTLEKTEDVSKILLSIGAVIKSILGLF
ncbi:MazG nucleotide pyrophosphohydrolase domain-containing protein [Celerinatantimonas sp. MCCC 1A17872]|uniref:MazG nucleotide pyrophosphohydrolase domain-containing protein n=1 Tax=Celerinatantimonas sp. MCCC 1A17872 TaxID=3177514 RepID=UPI0038C5C617